MSTTRKSIIFLAIAFAISWAIVIGGWAMGLHESPTLGVAVLALSMTGPAIAAFICAFAFERGQRVAALGLHFRPNLWWLFAWLIPIAIAAISVAATLLLSDRTYVDLGDASVAAVEAAGQDPAQIPPILLSGGFVIAMSVFLGALINTPILTFTEELGWRGYLHHLWRPAGFWRAALGTGAVWGVWHAPAIYLFGLNYPTERTFGIALFVIYCVLLAPLLTLVRDRGGSVWAAGILHGTFNAIPGLTFMALSEPTFPWNGIVGIGGFVALALGVAAVALLQNRTSPATA